MVLGRIAIPGVGALVEASVVGAFVVGATGTEPVGRLLHAKFVNSMSSRAMSPE